ncbi:MAG TPA: hypothetical protein EYG69_04520 [Campylobacterales bacterium]|nr:hypothetical protein [Campylobacterales bacterium]
MELILAKQSKSDKKKTITIDALEKELAKKEKEIFYFDQANSHKDLVALVETFEDKGFNVYLREVKYGLDEGDYMYEMHLL